jgi:hypothetical protein
MMMDDVMRRTKEERKGKTLHVNASNPFLSSLLLMNRVAVVIPVVRQ